MSNSAQKVRTPLFPPYSVVRHLLKIFEGVPKSEVTGMIQDIHGQMGTPQNPLDWSDPDTWIRERINGRSAELAQLVWKESGGEVNPRYTYGSYPLVSG